MSERMPTGLSGKTVLITGGSRGLGKEMSHAFAREGANLVIASRSQESCDRLAEEIRAVSGVKVLARGCHVGKWEDLDALAESAYAEFGQVDVLVNNAGMSPHYNRVDEVTHELWDKVVNVNMMGPFRLTALVGSRMAEGAGGSIINVSSSTSVRARKDVIPYAAAKAGVNALTQGFADAFGPNVRVNALLIGPFLTDVSAAWDMEKMEARLTRYPLKRAGKPEEVVGAALFLASDASSYTTGAIIPVDGGSSWAG